MNRKSDLLRKQIDLGHEGHWLESFPASAFNSALMKKSGFEVFEGLLDQKGQQLMLAEALSVAKSGYRTNIRVNDLEQIRGGSPARRFLSAHGGVIQDEFYNAPWLLQFLRSICGPSLVPTGPRGTFTYYIQTGDHLAIHRDIVTCDVAVITCLLDTARTDSQGGKSCLYPDRKLEPLSHIRQTPAVGAVKMRLLAGQTLVMFGGIVPHAIQPTEPGQRRIVSVLCYRV